MTNTLIATILLPVKVRVSKSKDLRLNLNVYRNTHYHTLNKAKIEFKRIVGPQVLLLPALDKIHIVYEIYPARLCDVANIICIQDKFFSDALVELGKIPDDNFNYILGSTSKFKAKDSKNPRTEAKIYRITK